MKNMKKSLKNNRSLTTDLYTAICYNISIRTKLIKQNFNICSTGCCYSTVASQKMEFKSSLPSFAAGINLAPQ
jgi:hypothetical protein